MENEQIVCPLCNRVFRKSEIHDCPFRPPGDLAIKILKEIQELREDLRRIEETLKIIKIRQAVHFGYQLTDADL